MKKSIWKLKYHFVICFLSFSKKHLAQHYRRKLIMNKYRNIENSLKNFLNNINTQKPILFTIWLLRTKRQPRFKSRSTQLTNQTQTYSVAECSCTHWRAEYSNFRILAKYKITHILFLSWCKTFMQRLFMKNKFFLYLSCRNITFNSLRQYFQHKNCDNSDGEDENSVINDAIWQVSVRSVQVVGKSFHLIFYFKISKSWSHLWLSSFVFFNIHFNCFLKHFGKAFAAWEFNSSSSENEKKIVINDFKAAVLHSTKR